MANYTAITNMTLEQAITTGSMVDTEDLTISAGAVVTCDQTPSILMGRITINDGKFLVDGQNISAGNMINFVGNYKEYMIVMGQGTFEVDGNWYDIGTTDGSNNQVFNLATYYDSSFCVDVVPMIQVETGRRITFDNASGTIPEVDDYIYKTLDHGVFGRIVTVASTYLVVKWLIGSLVDDDVIEVQKVVDNNGPDMQISWTADVNHASGDILESGVYQEFGNSRTAGSSYISSFNHGIGGFTFDNQFQSTILTMGTIAGVTGGFVPPSGCNVRIPNVIVSTSNSANYALNNTYYDGGSIETNRYYLNTNNAGAIDLSICNFGNSFFGCANASSFVAKYVGATICMGSTSAGSKTTYNHCVVIEDPMNICLNSNYLFSTTDLLHGTEIIDCLAVISHRQRYYIGAETSYNVKVKGCIYTKSGIAAWNTHENYLYYFNKCTDVEFNNNIAMSYEAGQGPLNIALCTNLDMNNFKFSMTQNEIKQEAEYNAININGINVRIAGVDVIGSGVPGNFMFNAGDVVGLKLYAMGMIDNKIDIGSDCEQLVWISGVSNYIEIGRIWLSGGIGYTGIVNTLAIQKNIDICNCSRRYDSGVMPICGDNANFKGVHCASGNIGSSWYGLSTNYAACYGSHWHDFFRSDTTGVIAIIFPPKTITTDAVYTIDAGAPKYFKDGDLDMINGDIITYEMQYFTKGHTGFSGVTTFTTSTVADGTDQWINVTKEFQYDNDGTGYNGTWLDLTTTSNLTGITVNPSNGIKLKVKLTAIGIQTNMCGMFIHTTTTIAAQKANFYPVDQNTCTVNLNGVVIGSRYWIYDSDTGIELTEGTCVENPVVETVTVPNRTNLLIRVRKSSAAIKYLPFATTAITNTTDIDVAIIQIEDIIA